MPSYYSYRYNIPLESSFHLAINSVLWYETFVLIRAMVDCVLHQGSLFFFWKNLSK